LGLIAIGLAMSQRGDITTKRPSTRDENRMEEGGHADQARCILYMLIWKAQKASSSYISPRFPSLKRASNTRHIRSHYYQRI
jgi:hypothetical protein